MIKLEEKILRLRDQKTLTTETSIRSNPQQASARLQPRLFHHEKFEIFQLAGLPVPQFQRELSVLHDHGFSVLRKNQKEFNLHEKESPPLKRGFTRARKGAPRGGTEKGEAARRCGGPRGILRGIKITRNYVCSPEVEKVAGTRAAASKRSFVNINGGRARGFA